MASAPAALRGQCGSLSALFQLLALSSFLKSKLYQHPNVLRHSSVHELTQRNNKTPFARAVLAASSGQPYLFVIDLPKGIGTFSLVKQLAMRDVRCLSMAG